MENQSTSKRTIFLKPFLILRKFNLVWKKLAKQLKRKNYLTILPAHIVRIKALIVFLTKKLSCTNGTATLVGQKGL